MAPIDLKQFADHSQKIPGKYLSEVNFESNTRKVLLSHLLDFIAIFGLTWSMKFLMEASVATLLVGKSLKSVWMHTPTNTIFPFFFMMTAGTYFFFSYFINHGQTWGMNKMKLRASMKEYNFKDAATWTLFSMTLYLTGSLFYSKSLNWVQSQGAGKISTHDFRYQEFVSIKDENAPSLFKMLETTEELQYDHNSIAA